MLNELIEQLNTCKNSQIEKTLSEIGEDILKDYELKLDDGTILYPLWIEAYCFINDRFEDDCCDGSLERKHKKNNCQFFGQKEIHWGRQFENLHFSYAPQDINSKFWRRCRVDIVPEHDGSFALSYLLKLCVIKQNDVPNLLIQSEIAELLKDKKVELVKRIKTKECTIKTSARVGIKDDKFSKLSLHFSIGNYASYEEIRSNRNSDEFKEQLKVFK